MSANNDLPNLKDSVSFGGIKIGFPISKNLQSMNITIPTPIQKAAIAPLTAGISAILHAETGSGKTLAYVLPLLKRLLSNEKISSVPLQAIIIVPTRELAIQVFLIII